MSESGEGAASYLTTCWPPSSQSWAGYLYLLSGPAACSRGPARLWPLAWHPQTTIGRDSGDRDR